VVDARHVWRHLRPGAWPSRMPEALRQVRPGVVVDFCPGRRTRCASAHFISQICTIKVIGLARGMHKRRTQGRLSGVRGDVVHGIARRAHAAAATVMVAWLSERAKPRGVSRSACAGAGHVVDSVCRRRAVCARACVRAYE
jgi:hypothetical protein